MLIVSDLMRSPVLGVSVDADLEEVDRELQEHGVSALVVYGRDGALAGVVTRTDLVRVARQVNHTDPRRVLLLPDIPVARVMAKNPICVAATDPMAVAARHLVDNRIHRVVVLDGGEPVGVIATREVIKAAELERVEVTLGRAMTRGVRVISGTDSMDHALELIADHGMHGLVVERDGIPIGTVSLDDVLVAEHWPRYSTVDEWMTPRVVSLPATMPLYRAATHALATCARHVVVMDAHGMCGIVTGIDFARAYLNEPAQAVA